MAWIRTVSDEEATGRLARLLDEARQRAGRVYQIVRLHSLNPGLLDASMRLYGQTTSHPRAPLPRTLREMIAVVVSRTNECFY